jgi:hypothetical protein
VAQLEGSSALEFSSDASSTSPCRRGASTAISIDVPIRGPLPLRNQRSPITVLAMPKRLWFAMLILALGCDSGGGIGAGGDDPRKADAGKGTSPDAAFVPDCSREASAEDRQRAVVISHPFDAPGVKGGRYRAFSLSETGELSTTDQTFMMGTATQGRIVFTPDGEIGLVAQDDGTLGVFRVSDDGTVEVIAARYEGSFYADSVVMDPSGVRAYVLDNQWREHGGGVYSVKIGCDGTLVDEGQVVPAKLPSALVLMEGRALLAASDAMTSPTDRDAHLLSWGNDHSLMESVSLFSGGGANISTVEVTADHRWVLIADNAEFSGVANRIAVVEVTDANLKFNKLLTPIQDPMSIAFSPFDGSAIVASGYGDAIFRLAFDASAASPFSIEGELTYTGPAPQLPAASVMIHRGALKGHVLLAEVSAIRQLQFPAEGGVQDLGAFEPGGTSVADIVGAIGVQP